MLWQYTDVTSCLILFMLKQIALLWYLYINIYIYIYVYAYTCWIHNVKARMKDAIEQVSKILYMYLVFGGFQTTLSS